MDGRHEVTMSDDALDRELRAALNVEPSPGFLARVRGRVADESPVVARPFALRWLTMSAGAALAAIAVAVFLWSPLRSGGGSVPLNPGATPALGGAPSAPLDASIRSGDPSAPPRAAGRGVESTAAPGASARNAESAGPARTPVRRRQASESAVDAAAPGTPDAVNAVSERAPFAEVLISPEEVRAYRVLLAAVEQRRLPPLPQREPAADDGDALDIVIEPLVIDPLPPMVRLE